MSTYLDETIAAVASPPGGAADAVIRISGSDAVACIARCFRADDGRTLKSIRRPTVMPGSVMLSSLDRRLPALLYLWPTKRSYTREPAGELHTLGSPPLAEAVLEALCAAGARVARPGEFTLRAFLAGRLDLTQAEAVLGVIDARAENDLACALRQLAGGMAAPLGALRDALLDMLAELEAGLDFAEEDLEFIAPEELARRLAEASGQVEELNQRVAARHESTAAARVVLVGLPNVGKSSLFNALIGGAEALVADAPGTTRDYLTARIELDGVAVELIDTAGVDSDVAALTPDQLAQTSAREQHEQAVIEILCLDASRPRNDWEIARINEASHARRIVAWTKADRVPADVIEESDGRAISTSSVTGDGVDHLRRRLAEEAAATGDGDVLSVTAARSRESLRLAAECLASARAVLRGGGGEELIAAELRVALAELGRVVGAVYTDDVLDRIFSRFCIGK